MNMTNYRSRNMLYLVLLAAYCVVMLVWIDTGPKVWVDEAWESIPGFQLAAKGELNNPVLSGTNAREQHLLDPQMTYYLLLAAAFKIIGFGIYAGRFVSVVAGLLVVAMTYFLARRYYGENVGLLAALMVMINNVVFVSAATVRPEAAVAATTLAAFYFLMRGIDEEKHRFFAFSGLLVGVGLHVHPNSALGAVALVAVFAAQYRHRFILQSSFWIFALFAVIGVLPYAIYVFVEDYRNQFQHFQMQIGHRAQSLAQSKALLQTIKSEVARYTQYVFFPKRVLIALLEVVAVFWGLANRDKPARLLALVVLVHMALFPVLIMNKTARYLTVLMPMTSILVAVFLCKLAGVANGSWLMIMERVRSASFRTIAALLLCLGYLGNQAAGDAWLMWKNRTNDYSGFTARLDEHIPDGARVWGSMTFWVGLHEHPYRTQYTYCKDLDSFRPEYVILYDSDIWEAPGGITHRKRSNLGLIEVREKIESLVRERGSFVADVKDPVYGSVEIHRVDW